MKVQAKFYEDKEVKTKIFTDYYNLRKFLHIFVINHSKFEYVTFTILDK